MNVIALLDTHGPAPTPGTAALDRARAALYAEIQADAQPAVPVTRLRPAGGFRRRVIGLGLAAATVAGAAVLTPTLLGLGGNTAIALGPAQPLAFPLTPTSVPAGLGEPVFERDSDFWLAQYRGAGADRVSVIVPESLDHWQIPSSATTVDVDGQQGLLFEQADGAVVVAWTEADGDVVGVSGRGEFADPARVEAFAESLTDRPQQVDLILSVAPSGWSATAYKQDRTVQYTGDDGSNLTVTLVDELLAGLEGYGATEVAQVEVSGRPASIGHTGDGWVLETRTAQGSPFSLLAPGSFTRAQVVEVAAGVRHRD